MYLHLLCSLLLFSRSVVSNHLQPHGLQHSRLPCPPLSPGFCPNSCPLSQWCHPTISSSVALFSSCLLSFPTSGSFPVSWLSISGGQSIGASASASALVLPMNIQSWFPLGLTGLSPCYPKDSQEFSPVTQFKSISSSVLSLLMVQLSHPYMITGKATLWLDGPLSAKCCLCFLMCFLGGSWLFFQRASVFYVMAAVTIHSIIGAQENEFVSFHSFPIYLPRNDRTGCQDLRFLKVKF